MKVYTKSGDTGKTSLIGGKRLSKAHPRIEAYGTVDELNACIGLVRDQEVNASRKGELVLIQNKLFSIGALLAADPEKEMSSKMPKMTEKDIAYLERAIDTMDSELPPMRFFVLPGGHVSVSHCHVARVVCRRAERACIFLQDEEQVVPEFVIKYLNRLSDYLFVLSRFMTLKLNAEEIPWKNE